DPSSHEYVSRSPEGHDDPSSCEYASRSPEGMARGPWGGPADARQLSPRGMTAPSSQEYLSRSPEGHDDPSPCEYASRSPEGMARGPWGGPADARQLSPRGMTAPRLRST